MSLEVSFGTITWNCVVYALLSKPTDVGDGIYEATAMSDGGATITARWLDWQSEWSEYDALCDWPNPTEVMHIAP